MKASIYVKRSTWPVRQRHQHSSFMQVLSSVSVTCTSELSVLGGVVVAVPDTASGVLKTRCWCLGALRTKHSLVLIMVFS